MGFNINISWWKCKILPQYGLKVSKTVINLNSKICAYSKCANAHKNHNGYCEIKWLILATISHKWKIWVSASHRLADFPFEQPWPNQVTWLQLLLPILLAITESPLLLWSKYCECLNSAEKVRLSKDM